MTIYYFQQKFHLLKYYHPIPHSLPFICACFAQCPNLEKGLHERRLAVFVGLAILIKLVYVPTCSILWTMSENARLSRLTSPLKSGPRPKSKTIAVARPFDRKTGPLPARQPVLPAVFIALPPLPWTPLRGLELFRPGRAALRSVSSTVASGLRRAGSGACWAWRRRWSSWFRQGVMAFSSAAVKLSLSWRKTSS